MKNYHLYGRALKVQHVPPEKQRPISYERGLSCKSVTLKKSIKNRVKCTKKGKQTLTPTKQLKVEKKRLKKLKTLKTLGLLPNDGRPTDFNSEKSDSLKPMDNEADGGTELTKENDELLVESKEILEQEGIHFNSDSSSASLFEDDDSAELYHLDADVVKKLEELSDLKRKLQNMGITFNFEPIDGPARKRPLNEHNSILEALSKLNKVKRKLNRNGVTAFQLDPLDVSLVTDFKTDEAVLYVDTSDYEIDFNPPTGTIVKPFRKA